MKEIMMLIMKMKKNDTNESNEKNSYIIFIELKNNILTYTIPFCDIIRQG